MRIIYGLGTIEFISWRSVGVRIRFLLVGKFTSDIWLIGQSDNDSAKTKLELSLVLWPLFIDIATKFVRKVLLLFFETLKKETSKFLDVSLKPSYPPSFLSKFVGIGFPNLSGCFLFLVEVREGSGGSGCWCSAEPSSWCEGPVSVLWNFGSDWDMVYSTTGSVFTLSSPSLAIWLSLTRKVLVEFSGCMKDVFNPFLKMKVAGAVFVFSLASNRMGSHKSKSAIAGILTVRPNSSLTGVLLLVFEVLRCVISALCRNAPNDTLRKGVHAWSAGFTVLTALSASPLALGW